VTNNYLEHLFVEINPQVYEVSKVSYAKICHSPVAAQQTMRTT